MLQWNFKIEGDKNKNDGQPDLSGTNLLNRLWIKKKQVYTMMKEVSGEQAGYRNSVQPW